MRHDSQIYSLLGRYPTEVNLEDGSHRIIRDIIASHKSKVLQILTDFNYYAAKELFGKYSISHNPFDTYAEEPRWMSHIRNIKSMTPDEIVQYLEEDRELRYSTSYDED